MDVRRVYPYALFAFLAATAVRPLRDPDVWWHLRTGELIGRVGVPRTDPYSFTFGGTDWVAHEWLSEVIMWRIHEFGGFTSLAIFFAGVIVVTWFLVYRICEGRPYLAGLVVAVASTASEVVWGPRPQLFNLLLLAAVLFLLERRKARAIGHWIFLALPILLLLWANLHSGFLLGLVTLAAYWLGESLQHVGGRRVKRTLSRRDVNRLGLASVTAAGLTFLNPHGARLWVYPFETLTSPAQRQYIAEWFPPQPDQLAFWLVIALVAVTLVSMIMSPVTADATDWIILVGVTVGAFLSLRNVAIFAVVIAPIMCRYTKPLLETRVTLLREPSPTSGRWSVPTVGAAVIITLITVGMAASAISRNDAQIRERFPVDAVDWLEDSETDALRIFNSYNMGGYLIWRNLEVFIDGRADVYGDDHLERYATAYFGEDGWDEVLEEFMIELVLVEPGAPLAQTLETNPDWSMTYEDEAAVVFEPRRP